MRPNFGAETHAMGLARAHGLLFEGLLQVLRVSGVLSPEGTAAIFKSAIAVIEENPTTDPNRAAAIETMRRIIGEIAEIHGVKLPAPGQTAGAPKH